MRTPGVFSRTEAGVRVTGTDRINQQLDMLLQTPKGSVIGDPNKGVRDDIMDLPANEVVGALVGDLNRQLALYLPDIKVDRIRTEVENGRVLLIITWTYKTGKNGGGELAKEL